MRDPEALTIPSGGTVLAGFGCACGHKWTQAAIGGSIDPVCPKCGAKWPADDAR